VHWCPQKVANWIVTLPSTILITGGAGFLGQACARQFHAAGWRVVGIGHGHWTIDEAHAAGFDHWVNAPVSIQVLTGLEEKLQAVAHCAGNGSVPYSLQQPLAAFENTVGTTALLLEYLRLHAPKAVVLYPSSAAVYGAAAEQPLRETVVPNPVSPYGFHKQMVELLLATHAQAFGQPAVAIRFFSIFGPGLRKQLLWDASTRLLSGESPQLFWGTGDETRDWIYVDDAASLMLHLAEQSVRTNVTAGLKVINGASGIRVTVSEVLGRLAEALGSSAEISFNGEIRVGDPRFYHADVTQLRASEWQPSVSLDHGIANYAAWIRANLKSDPLR
jgi:UDP-glucose 4-epimerase